MLFRRLSDYFQQLEKTTLRNKMTEILASLFKEASTEEIGKICYLLQGRVVPLYEAIEFGVADKMMIRAVAEAISGISGSDLKSPKGLTLTEVVKEFKKVGDLGSATEKIKNLRQRRISLWLKKSKIKNIHSTSSGQAYKKLKIIDIYKTLYKIATVSGEGSQEEKVRLLAGLIRDVDPLSARYIVRIPLGKLRLGFSDMTILDAFSWMLEGTKAKREEIEKAYHVRPDLSFIATQVKKYGLVGLGKIKPSVGTPILMARANRLSSSAEILEKIGKCGVEYKYDGLRLQVHYKITKNKEQPFDFAQGKRTKNKNIQENNSNFVKLYSRNLEELTSMFPDIVEAVKKQVKVREVIFEGEIVAFNPKTGVSVAFQETMQRRRKYDIAQKAKEIPVRLYVFELLYLNGKNYIGKPYIERKKALKEIIKKGETLIFAQEIVTEEEEKIDEFFEDSVKKGFEGIIAKKLDGEYQAGMRGWNWIKYKKAMSKKLADTFDVVVMGYDRGEGKRTAFGIGEFLTGVKDEKKDCFVSMSKIGTGLTDEQFREFKKRVAKLEVKEKPKEYEVDKLLEMDVWLAPSLVVEVGADEITRSQVHTAGRVMGPSKSGTAFEVKQPGYSLRFPKLIRFRDDKSADEVTTLSEVRKMYKNQGEK